MNRLSDHPELCRWLADGVLVVHFAFVIFVVFGLAAVWAGYWRNWRWIRHLHFRLLHLLAIGFVAYEAVTDRDCPLTIWENQLRLWAGLGQEYQGSFLQHWIHRVLFYDAGETTFLALYVLVFGLTGLSFWTVPPQRPRRTSRQIP